MNSIYDINKTYDENFDQGPFFTGEIPKLNFPEKNQWHDFLGYQIAVPIGVPAGPLLNSNWIKLAANLGFCVPTYKTIRSNFRACQPFPNMIYVETNGQLNNNRLGEKLHPADHVPESMEKLAVTNSFGMPSKDEKFLMADIEKANSYLVDGQVMTVSVVGTPRDGVDLGDDYARTAAIAKEAGAKIIEANFSCPNVRTGEGSIYSSPETVHDFSQKIIKEIKDIPLIIKMGNFTDLNVLREVLITAARAGVRAVAGINTIGMAVIDAEGNPALGGNRLISGICGSPIRTNGLEWTKNVSAINKKEKLGLTIIGMGGITLPEQFDKYLNAGADVAMSATGMMWDPYLVAKHCHSDRASQ